MITHSYKLDMCPGGVPLAINLSQYDSDVQLVFELFASRGSFVIESGTTVAIRGTKPDGNGIDLDAAISDNVVTVSVTQQMTAVAGTSYYELTLYKGEKELNTANFRLIIERAALDKDTLISGSEIRELVDIIDRTDEIIQAAADIQQTAEDLQEYVDAKEAEISQITTDAEETAQEALDEVTNVKNDLRQRYSKILESDATEPDLDIADPSGNVIMRLQDGHIQTKEFDSADVMQDIADIQDDISDLSSDKVDVQQSVSDAGKALIVGQDGRVSPVDVTIEVDDTLTQEGKAADAKAVGDAIADVEDSVSKCSKISGSDAMGDLDIADIYGNVLVRFEDGNCVTKNFNGFKYMTFKSATGIYNGQQLTLTVNQTFKRGDKIVIHMERGAMPWNTGAIVSYYENQIPIKENWRGDCAWIEHTIMQDGAQISAVYPAGSTNMTNGNVRLEVSLLGDIPITPTIVKIKQDGTGDFTTLRAALDSIGTDANDVLNPYRIEIYPGTYDVMDDYTDEEIADAAYDNTHFVGPRLLNGVYLVGIGNPNDIILNGVLDTSKWNKSIRNVVSTLNCQGACGMENMTVVATDLRYCVHDDYSCPFGKPYKRLIKNCIFRAYGDMAYTPAVTYGAGTRPSGNIFDFQDCDFGLCVGVHTANPLISAGSITYRNCRGVQCDIGDILDSDNQMYTPYEFINCDFDETYVHNWQSEDYSTTHVCVTAIGGADTFYIMPSFVPYITKDVKLAIPLNLPVGMVVEQYYTGTKSLSWRVATSVDTACGVVIYNGEDTHIQKSGYIPTNHVDISSCALGDYIGVIDGKLAVIQNSNDAIGKVVLIDKNGVGHIKMNWRS